MSANLNLIYSEFILNVANDSERIVYVFDEYRLDAARRMLYRGETELALSPKAVETLLALLDRRGEIVSKDELMKTIWAGTIVEESNLQHYLHVLRKTLGARRDGKPFIETFRRRGYRFSADVQIIEKTVETRNNAAFWSEKPDENFYNPRRIHQTDESFEPKDTHEKASFGGYWRFASAAVFVGVVALTIFLYSRFQTSNNVQAVNAPLEISITNLTDGNPVFNATISNDGSYFVYTEIEGDIYRLILQQTGQPTRLEIVPAGERVISGATFSPNGEFVYFIGFEKGEADNSLYRVPSLGGAVSKILTNIASPVSFSPDGREIVFSRYVKETKEHTLIIADRDGGNERILLTRSGAEQLSSGNAWSPDRKTVAFSEIKLASSGEGICSISAVDIKTGAVKPLSTEKWDTCFRMMWTRDGAGLVFIGTRDGESYSTRRDQIYYLDAATGNSRRLTSDSNRYQDSCLGITDDNVILAVPHSRFSQIWAMNADGDARSAIQITNGVADGRVGIAPLPDGRIGYITRSGEKLSLWMTNADGSEQKQIFSDLPFIEELRATPDGRYFIFSARRDKYSHLYRLDTDGSNLKQLTSGESYEMGGSISPDSQWIFYGTMAFDNGRWKTSLQKIPIDGGASVRLTADATKQFFPHLSPDGKYVADISADGKLLLTTNDGAFVKTLERVRNSVFQINWLPSGEALTYPVYKQNLSNIWQHPINGEKPRPLTDFASGTIFNHAFSTDGKKLYVSRGYQTRNAVLIKNFKAK